MIVLFVGRLQRHPSRSYRYTVILEGARDAIKRFIVCSHCHSYHCMRHALNRSVIRSITKELRSPLWPEFL